MSCSPSSVAFINISREVLGYDCSLADHALRKSERASGGVCSKASVPCIASRGCAMENRGAGRTIWGWAKLVLSTRCDPVLLAISKIERSQHLIHHIGAR